MNHPVFIIAEAGVNHDGSLTDALRMIDVAADAGADAVKFQTFRADEIATKHAAKALYQVRNTGSADSQLDMLRALELGHEAHRTLAAHAIDRGIGFMSTAFDLESLDFLASLDMPAIKIPSGDLTWATMLLRASRMGRPLIISTGMAEMHEVQDALSIIAFGLTRSGFPASTADLEAAYLESAAQGRLRETVTLLHCVTDYPAPLGDVNLRAMDLMAEVFGLPVGYSDHTEGTSVAIAAAARGARVIEKHFTLDRARCGPDHAASLEPGALKAMIAAIRDVEVALGQAIKRPSIQEYANRTMARRSLVAAVPISAGEVFSDENLTAKRPAGGASPMSIWSRIGQLADRAYAIDDEIGP
jgi:N-acetylneuraminate synthase